MTRTRRLAAAAMLLSAACAPAAAPGVGGPEPLPPPDGSAAALPPIPARAGEPRIDVVYPGEGQALTTRGSNFVFGSVGTGNASLTINGEPVEVKPNGAWLAYLPVPEDGVYRLEATAGGRTVRAERRVEVPAFAGSPPEAGGGVRIVPGSLTSGRFTEPEGTELTVRFRGTPGGRARLVFPDGTSVPLTERTVTERDGGFMQDRASAPREFTEYVGAFPVRAPLLPRDRRVGLPRLAPPPGGTGTATVELVVGGDTVRRPLDVALGVLPAGAARAAVAAGDRADGMVIGTAVPGGGTPYHWFFPDGTRLAVVGERGDELRVRLTSDLHVWVDAGAVRLQPPGTPAPEGAVGAVRLEGEPGWVDVRLSTTERLPFHVDVTDRWLTVSVYGAETRTNWVYYGPEDPLVRGVQWDQPRDDLYRLRLELAEPVWGWKTFWDEDGSLVVRVRRPPALDAGRPLAGLRVAVDAGHPPGGAIGPTRLTEAEANLAIARRLTALLRERGAEVVEIRPDTAAVALGDRPVRAEAEDAHLLISVHNNAFPDGVDPFENNGTSVFYNRPQSLGLARHLQRELLRELGLRDLGIGRADLALVRPTWMPSALTETMFLMIPEQEAALRDPDVQERIARAHLRAVEAFLRDRAAAQGASAR